MKKGQVRLILISLVLIAIMAVNCFANIFNKYTFVLFLFVSFLIIRKLIGFDWKNTSYTKNDVLITVLMYSVFYSVLTYLMGLFLGFLNTGYNLTILNIIKNIVINGLIIGLVEIIRYAIIKKGYKYKSIIVLSVIVFILSDITLVIRGFDLSIGSDLLKFMLSIVFTSIAKNVFLTYLTLKVGYKSAIAYRLVMELPAYFMPFFPDLGIYIDTIFKIILPAIITIVVYFKFIRNNPDEVDSKNNKVVKKIVMAIIIIALLVLVGLTTGIFKYHSLVIGSGSMTPNINKGDIIIVKKLNDKEKEKLAVDDVLVFKHEDITVVHRIIEIVEEDGEYTYYTQGDNNPTPDDYPITTENVIGTTNMRIMYIGWPTIWLSDLLK